MAPTDNTAEPAVPPQQVLASHDQDRSRLLANAFADYFLRICRLRAPLYDDDVETAMIADAVGLNTVAELLADARKRRRYQSLDKVVGAAQRGSTALAIAGATGLPRETVRRKLKHLIEIGLLVRRADGEYVYRAGVLREPAFARMIEQIEAETVRFFNQCLADGVIALPPP